jgi:hypothetical protein
MSSSHVQALSALLGTILIVILTTSLIERFVPHYYQGSLPVLIAVIAGSQLPTRIDGYLKRCFPKNITDEPPVRPTTISRSLIVNLLGLHVLAIGAIILM